MESGIYFGDKSKYFIVNNTINQDLFLNKIIGLYHFNTLKILENGKYYNCFNEEIVNRDKRYGKECKEYKNIGKKEYIVEKIDKFNLFKIMLDKEIFPMPFKQFDFEVLNKLPNSNLKVRFTGDNMYGWVIYCLSGDMLYMWECDSNLDYKHMKIKVNKTETKN